MLQKHYMADLSQAVDDLSSIEYKRLIK